MLISFFISDRGESGRERPCLLCCVCGRERERCLCSAYRSDDDASCTLCARGSVVMSMKADRQHHTSSRGGHAFGNWDVISVAPQGHCSPQPRALSLSLSLSLSLDACALYRHNQLYGRDGAPWCIFTSEGWCSIYRRSVLWQMRQL